MLQCKERLDEGWRKPDGYWGIVLTKSGLGNSQSKRKRLYMDWKRNFNNFRDKYFQRKTSMHEYVSGEDEV